MIKEATIEYYRLMNLKKKAPKCAIFFKIDTQIIEYLDEDYGVKRKAKIAFDYANYITPSDENYVKIEKPQKKGFWFKLEGVDVYQEDGRHWIGLRISEPIVFEQKKTQTGSLGNGSYFDGKNEWDRSHQIVTKKTNDNEDRMY
jgi:hypothetical protein